METLDKFPRTLTPEEREAIIESLRRELQKRLEIVFAYLLGSFAEGLPFRDIDIAVWVEGVSREQALDYEAQVATDLTRIWGIEVDVRLLNFAPLGFRLNAVNGILLFSRDDEFRLNFIEQVSLAYMDFSWLARQMLKDALE
ncbi:MAG: nucleotidyltransferase domain-containing protein [Candidatus Fervidibacter sacchari]